MSARLTYNVLPLAFCGKQIELFYFLTKIKFPSELGRQFHTFSATAASARCRGLVVRDLVKLPIPSMCLCGFICSKNHNHQRHLRSIAPLLQLHRIPQPKVLIVLMEPGIAGLVAQVFQVHHKIPGGI